MIGKFIDPCENSLTAAVFSHLLHLPAEDFWKILRRACHNGHLPPFPGELSAADYWPSWDADGTDNRYSVRPDLLLRFPGLDLIIEAKRWDGDMQNPTQWRNEVTAYANEYARTGAPVAVRLIALGAPIGEPDTRIAPWDYPHHGSVRGEGHRSVFACPVHMCRWERLLNECQRARDELRRASDRDSRNHAHLRILADVMDLFARHGFQTGRWFADFIERRPKLGPVECHYRVFKSLSHRLTPS